ARADIEQDPTKIVKLQRCEYVRAGFHGLLDRLPVVTNRVFPSGLHLRNDRKTIIRRSSWKDWTVAPCLKFKIALFGDRHCSGLCPVKRAGRSWLRALAGCCQLRNLNFVGRDGSCLRFGARRSAECQRRCGGGCAQEAAASGVSELIV